MAGAAGVSGADLCHAAHPDPAALFLESHIRHLVLPSYIENSKKVLKWIKDNLDDKIYVSIMAQYFPTYKAKEYEKINRKLTKEEWKEIENYIEKLEIENGYMQELGEHEEEYVPKWDI